jgi:hypothetical protein
VTESVAESDDITLSYGPVWIYADAVAGRHGEGTGATLCRLASIHVAAVAECRA